MKTMSHPRLMQILSALCAAVPAFAAQHAAAQAFPTKNIQMIVPYTAGGSIDLFSRAVAQRLTVAWGRNVVVDNRPGASGMIGTEVFTKLEPDGHALLGHTSSYPATAAVRAKLRSTRAGLSCRWQCSPRPRCCWRSTRRCRRSP